MPTKVIKIRRRDVQSTFCKKNFIESNAVVIRKLISLTPKNTRQQREMIRVFLRCFLQKLFHKLLRWSPKLVLANDTYMQCSKALLWLSTSHNPSLYGVFWLNRNYVPRKVTENPKSRAKSLLSTSAAER